MNFFLSFESALVEIRSLDDILKGKEFEFVNLILPMKVQ
jgi:hypothetical protein